MYVVLMGVVEIEAQLKEVTNELEFCVPVQYLMQEIKLCTSTVQST